jgi:hypothetical protein
MDEALEAPHEGLVDVAALVGRQDHQPVVGLRSAAEMAASAMPPTSPGPGKRAGEDHKKIKRSHFFACVYATSKLSGNKICYC